MQENKQNYKDYSLYVVLLMLFMVGMLLLVQGYVRQRDFAVYQESLMTNAVHTEAAELTGLISRLQAQVELFATEQYDIINYLSTYPNNEEVRQRLEDKVARQFPDYFAVTITAQDGKPVFEDFDLLVNEICQEDLRKYVTNNYQYDLYIHPHSDVYHIDIMAPWGNTVDSRERPASPRGVFFVSFRTELLANSLANSEVGGHKLMLLRKDVPGLIEVSAEGDRRAIPDLDGEYILAVDLQETISYREPVGGSRWELVAVPDISVNRAHLNVVVLQSLSLLFAVALISIITLRFIRQAEQRRSASEQRLQTARDHLQRALHFSQVVMCDWEMGGDHMHWSENANQLFSTNLPASFADYIARVHTADRDALRSAINQCLATGNAYSNEHRMISDGEREKWIEVSGNYEDNNETGESRMISLVTDISNRKFAEQEKLDDEQKQRETLIREVHHRIKNNLQGVIGLLQQHTSQDVQVNDVINAAISQVFSVSSVYGLQCDDSHSQIRLYDLMDEICTATANLTGRAIESDLAESCKDDFVLVEDKAVAVALVLNELLFNAIKHGLNRYGSPVKVSLQCDNNDAIVEISNHSASPAHFDFNSGTGLGTGLTLLRSLLPKQGATLTFTIKDGMVIARLTLGSPVLSAMEDEK